MSGLPDRSFAEHASNDDVQLPTDYVNFVLDYVIPSERRIISAWGNSTEISTLVRRDTPSYTKQPVAYLSSSEVAISSAQVGHLLFDCFARHPSFPFSSVLRPEALARARTEHEIYFRDLQIKFKKRIEADDYLLTARIERCHATSRLLVGKVTFEIEVSVFGAFTAMVPLEERNDELSDHHFVHRIFRNVIS